jgi:hypothetical protein
MKTGRQSGYTLIELTLVVGLSMLIAVSLVGMFQVHLRMLNEAVKYEFLAQDAPFIGLLLTRTIGNAEDYRIYSSRSTAVATNGTPVLTGPAVKLWMRQPNSSFRQAVLSFESINGHPGIYFFLADSTGTFPAAPNWELAGGQLTAATFDANSAGAPGILLATLTGSYNDQYTFAAEKQ